MIPVVLIMLALLPTPIAERYTSPTQDGQYVLNPLRSYGFLLALMRAGDSAVLSSSGKALETAKTSFMEMDLRASRVELLYLADRPAYVYLRKAGGSLVISDPPPLAWEVWGRARDRTAADEPLDVIGYLDYASGALLGNSGRFAGHLTVTATR